MGHIYQFTPPEEGQGEGGQGEGQKGKEEVHAGSVDPAPRTQLPLSFLPPDGQGEGQEKGQGEGQGEGQGKCQGKGQGKGQEGKEEVHC